MTYSLQILAAATFISAADASDVLLALSDGSTEIFSSYTAS